MGEESQEGDKLETLFEHSTELIAISAKISSDRLKLFLECVVRDSQGIRTLTQDSVTELLTANLSEVPIDKGVIDELVKSLHQGKPELRVRIAKGLAPEDGKDGKLVYLVKRYEGKRRDIEREEGNIRELHLFDNIELGQDIARLYLPVPGKDGVDVFGKVVAAKVGRECDLKTDSSIELKDKAGTTAYRVLVATKAGFLLEDKGVLQIRDEFVAEGDVDFTTGNLDFIGRMKVTGSVLTDFNVVANGDIEIHGEVQGGFVKSIHGSVTVKGGIIGSISADFLSHEKHEKKETKEKSQERPNVWARGTVSALRVQGARIESHGDVMITKEVMNSVIRTRGSLLMPQGDLFASQVFTSKALEAREIGSTSAIRTLIFLVSEVESSGEYAELLRSIEKHDEVTEVIQLQLGPYAEEREKLSQLKPPLRKRAELLLKKLSEVEASKKVLLEKQAELFSNQGERPPARINVHGRVFPGTEIFASDKSLAVEEEIVGPKTIEFQMTEEEQFVIGELKPLAGGEEESASETPTASEDPAAEEPPK